MSTERERDRSRARAEGIAIGAGGLLFIEACAIGTGAVLQRLGLWRTDSGHGECDSGGTGPRYAEATPTPASVCILPAASNCEVSSATPTPTPTSTPEVTPTLVICGTPVVPTIPTEYRTPRPPGSPTPSWPTPVPTNPDRGNTNPGASDKPDRNPPTQIP